MKGGEKDPVVPVVGRAAAALDIYLRDARPELVKDPRAPALFITTWGTRLNTKRIQDLVRTTAKAAGIDVRVTPHTLRQGYATHLLQGGADVRHVQKLLGSSHHIISRTHGTRIAIKTVSVSEERAASILTKTQITTTATSTMVEIDPTWRCGTFTHSA